MKTTSGKEAAYEVHFGRLARMLLPFGMRSASVLELLRIGFSPYADRLAAVFAARRADDRFRLKYNGQVCYLRGALNEKFKSAVPGARFEVGEPGEPAQWIFARDEEYAEYRDAHLFAPGEKDAGAANPPFAPDEVVLEDNYHFVIRVPADLYAGRLDDIKRFVDSYRLVTRIPQYESI